MLSCVDTAASVLQTGTLWPLSLSCQLPLYPVQMRRGETLTRSSAGVERRCRFPSAGKVSSFAMKKNTWNLTVFCCSTLMKIIKITEVKRFLKWAQIVIWTTWHKLWVNGREYWCTDKQYFLLFAETNILIQVMIMR